MKNYIYYLWILFMSFGFAACNSDDDEQNDELLPEFTEERGEEPGTEYTVEEGAKYLNVFYFVPQDMEPVEDWHWRLSGVMNHVQDFYGTNLSKYYGVDQNFKLLRNQANSSYVKINLIRGSKPAASYTTVYHVQYEVEEYLRSHPEDKSSHHSVVLLPKYNGAPTGVAYGYDATNIPNECIGIVACDGAEFNVKYFRYVQYRKAYLNDLGEVIRATGLAMGLTYNAPGKYDVYSSVTTGQTSEYAQNPDKWRLTPGDREFLIHSELFQEDVDYSDISDVNINNVSITVENGNLKLSCLFSSTIKPVAFVVYNDFFRATEKGMYSEEAELMNENMSTVKDALMTVTTEISSLGMNMYSVMVEMPTTDIPEEYLEALSGQEYAKAELRFRMIHENGTCTPSLMYAKCGNYYEDNAVHPDRFRYFYYLEPLGVVEPLPYETHNDITSPAKNTWTVTSTNAATNLLYLFDGQVNGYWTWGANFSLANKPEFKVAFPGGGGCYIHGIKIHPGFSDDRVKAVSVKYLYWNFDKGGTETVTLENVKFVGEGKYYYYVDFTKNPDKTYYVYNFTVTVEATCGSTTTSMDEVGIY